MAQLTSVMADKILDRVSGSNDPILNKIDELICCIQSGEEIEYVEE